MRDLLLFGPLLKGVGPKFRRNGGRNCPHKSTRAWRKYVANYRRKSGKPPPRAPTYQNHQFSPIPLTPGVILPYVGSSMSYETLYLHVRTLFPATPPVLTGWLVTSSQLGVHPIIGGWDYFKRTRLLKAFATTTNFPAFPSLLLLFLLSTPFLPPW